MNAPIRPDEWELLSAYLDGILPEGEQRRVRQLLDQRGDLRGGLAELRRTRQVLRAAPRRRAPRNFTLSPAMARSARPRWQFGWVPALSFSSALATLLLIVTFAVRLSPAAAPNLLAAAPLQAAQEQLDKAAPTNPPIIAWSESAPGASGMGGGVGSAPAAAPTQAAAAPDQPTATGAPAPGDANQQKSAAAQPTATALPSPKAALPQAMAAPTRENAADSSTPAGPILGIAPTAERGSMIVPATPAADGLPARTAAPGFDWLPLQVGLAALALASGLAALILWRKNRP